MPSRSFEAIRLKMWSEPAMASLLIRSIFLHLGGGFPSLFALLMSCISWLCKSFRRL